MMTNADIINKIEEIEILIFSLKKDIEKEVKKGNRMLGYSQNWPEKLDIIEKIINL